MTIPKKNYKFICPDCNRGFAKEHQYNKHLSKCKNKQISLSSVVEILKKKLLEELNMMEYNFLMTLVNSYNYMNILLTSEILPSIDKKEEQKKITINIDNFYNSYTLSLGNIYIPIDFFHDEFQEDNVILTEDILTTYKTILNKISKIITTIDANQMYIKGRVLYAQIVSLKDQETQTNKSFIHIRPTFWFNYIANHEEEF